MAWCIANDLPEEAIGYGQAAGETATVAGLVDRLALPLYYDGRMATAGGMARAGSTPPTWSRFPALAVFGAWFRALTGRPEEAERWLVPRRGSHLGDPALGRQRDDRAVGGQPARAT